ncbi:MAG: T9SS type A sorting domain-containing protein [candidate division WOR-3 bacterium]
MKRVVAGVIIVVIAVFGANWVRAPKVSAVPIKGEYTPGLKPLPPPPTPKGTDVPVIIASIPDLRMIAGSPGKNIVFAEDGQNIAVIYGLFSGDPDNIAQTYVSYSTDRGQNWIQYGPLSTFNARRIYPGVDAEPNWPDPNDLRVHFAWHQAPRVSGSYVASPTFYAKEVSYPDGLITAAFELPNSEDWDVWLPCIAVKDSFVIYTASNNGTYLTTYDCYIWRSTDYGETWDGGRLFFPGPLDWMAGPHFRFGSDGYIFFLWNRALETNPDLYWPYYCESFDYGLTWTEPQLLWGSEPPYPDMSAVTGWWYMYDCEVVRDTPVVAIKFGTGNYDYGEIWAYRPVAGSPGSWVFRGTKLVGGDSTAPQTYARFPTVAADDYGNIFIGYQAIFEQPADTGQDCGMFIRYAGDTTWYDYGMITFNAATLSENHLEFAHNAPVIAGGDSTIVGMIYHNAETYPTSGNLYFDYVVVPSFPGIAEAKREKLSNPSVTVAPNPFHNRVKFTVTNSEPIKVLIYDVAGKLVRQLRGTTNLTWDGRNDDGALVNSGVYFYKVLINSGSVSGRLTFAR